MFKTCFAKSKEGIYRARQKRPSILAAFPETRYDYRSSSRPVNRETNWFIRLFPRNRRNSLLNSSSERSMQSVGWKKMLRLGKP
jgi:hypothetical protein